MARLFWLGAIALVCFPLVIALRLVVPVLDDPVPGFEARRGELIEHRVTGRREFPDSTVTEIALRSDSLPCPRSDAARPPPPPMLCSTKPCDWAPRVRVLPLLVSLILPPSPVELSLAPRMTRAESRPER